jgi:hypothetical protein
VRSYARRDSGHGATIDCRCLEIDELYGEEAGEYVSSHLQPDADGEGYVCPDTGRRWRLDDSDPEQALLVQV